ncbi:MAG TPA: FkbM family methyltransferase [Candidatus Saccharimonadales bacterium]|nr:FkbM family methyltransferase [Candidatus Saccharimonadales bacterium]
MQHENFFFVQIGAHDGISYDPIRAYILEYKWQGILVEPQRQMFDSLQQNYKESSHLILENCAITPADGPIHLYRPKQRRKGETEPDTLATILQNQWGGDLESEKVAGLTLASLLQKHHVEHLDFLQVDAEGFDDQIVKQALDLPEELKPRLIHFEIGWLPPKRIVALYQELTRHGYRINHSNGFPDNDTIAVRQSVTLRHFVRSETPHDRIP